MKTKPKKNLQGIFYTLALSLISTSTFSQSSEPFPGSGSITNEQKLENYVWSFSKSKAAQNDKSLIDFNVINNWQQLGSYLAISPNGMYFAYNIEHGTDGPDDPKMLDSVIVQSTDNSWRQALSGVKPGFFSGNNKQYIFEKQGSLHFLKLDGAQSSIVNNIVSYKVPGNDNHDWLAYQIQNNCIIIRNLATGKEKSFFGISAYSFDPTGKWLACTADPNQDGVWELIIYKLITGTEKHFPSVVDFQFASGGNSLLIKAEHNTDNGVTQSLKFVNLAEDQEKIIWSAAKKDKGAGECSMDGLGKQVVFVVLDSADLKGGNNIWYYKDGMDKAIQKVSNKTKGIDPTLQILNSVTFTDDAHYIKFSLQQKHLDSNSSKSSPQLEIWTHKDSILQTAQSSVGDETKNYTAVVSVENGRFFPLEDEERSLYLLQGNFAIVKKDNKKTHGARFWETEDSYNQDSNWVVSLDDGSSRPLPTKGWRNTLWFAPDGNYLVYFDPVNCHYFSYHLYNKELLDITPNLPKNQLSYVNRYLLTDNTTDLPMGIAAWLPEDKGLLVYDNYDIWKLSLDGKKSAINITNGYGNTHNIIFSLFNSERMAPETPPTLMEKQTLLLRSFNSKNKYNGFYQIKYNTIADPKLLYKGPYFMQFIRLCQDPNLSNKGKEPLKARDVNRWIVQRQCEKESPNYFETSDFKIFKRLTDLQPQKGYNWLSEELHDFKHLNGKVGQGILYKPDNFDSSKKYPVLIVFYGAYSNNLYQFPQPSYNYSATAPGASPIWFLTNGYLVFVPDIYVAPLAYGPEAYNVIEGAARYLKELPFVDSNRLGCASHSWSAKLGSYIFTHSKSFAATTISEGFLYGNMINVALSVDERGLSRLEQVERNFGYGNLWNNKNSWLDQTTVLNVDKSTGPLLLLCNKQSTNDYQEQTVELFIALLRLNKNVWWLKYAKGSHTLDYLSDQKDYTIRYTQYFDHYLKGAPAPRWMTHRAPYGQAAAQEGFNLDPAGSCGKDCEICKRWNQQYKLHPEMFAKPISKWYLDY